MEDSHFIPRGPFFVQKSEKFMFVVGRVDPGAKSEVKVKFIPSLFAGLCGGQMIENC